MTRFLNDNVLGDTPYTNGAIFCSPVDGAILTNSVLTRNAAGDVSANTGATLAAVITMPVTGLLRKITSLLTGLNADGTNPVLGDAPIAKGIQITDITPHYLITGAALTLHTVRIDRIKFVNNVANNISAVLANAANGLATAAQANPYTTKIAVVDGMDVTDNDDVVVEFAATTQGGGAYRLYGFTLHVSYNYN